MRMPKWLRHRWVFDVYSDKVYMDKSEASNDAVIKTLDFLSDLALLDSETFAVSENAEKYLT